MVIRKLTKVKTKKTLTDRINEEITELIDIPCNIHGIK